jgi:tartrate-resistant acid phosphatase type 5
MKTSMMLLVGVLLVLPVDILLAQSDSFVRFAVIGDYGRAGQAEVDVANLVKSWTPDFIITVGDNNYGCGDAVTIDANIGQFYHEFISPYLGGYGTGASANRFFPSWGNHDWGHCGDMPPLGGIEPYTNYFTLPGNERYYDFTRGGLIHLFALDSDPREPSGTTSTSAQAMWLQSKLAASSMPWKLVYFHHPPYSAGNCCGGSLAAPYMQWPFQAWGASAVLSGHAHSYERLILDNNFLYIVNGLGGADITPLGSPVPGTQIQYNADFGALLVIATTERLTFQFITRAGQVIDTYTILAGSTSPPR